MAGCGFGELLSAYADGQLRGGELDRFERHLSQCPDCRTNLKRMERLNELLSDSLREGPDADVSGRIEHLLRHRRLGARVFRIAAVLAAAHRYCWSST